MAYALFCSGPFTPMTCKMHMHKLNALSLCCALKQGYKTNAVLGSQAA